MLLLIAASLRDGTQWPNRQRLINDNYGTLHRLLACVRNLKKVTCSAQRLGGIEVCLNLMLMLHPLNYDNPKQGTKLIFKNTSHCDFTAQ